MKMKAEFLTTLQVKQLDRWNWELLSDLLFIGSDHQLVTVKKGTVTNFASVRTIRSFAVKLIALWLLLALVPQLSPLVALWVPLALQPYMLLAGIASLALYAAVIGYGNAASAVHDHLYESGVYSRAYCDWVFYHALRAEGVSQWRAAIMWTGVRLGGSKYYKNG